MASSLVTLAGAIFRVTLINEATILFYRPCISRNDESLQVIFSRSCSSCSYLLDAFRYPTTALLKKATVKSISVIWNDTIL
jgi:hypothetical protein